jgi:hypothetical protein
MAKKTYTVRNTAMLYALIAQLPGYDSRYSDLIKEGIVNDFLTKHYGDKHGRQLRVSLLSDAEYRELILDLKIQVNQAKTVKTLQGENVRKRLTHQILVALSRIGVTVINGDYGIVNYHISRIPASKRRILPQVPTDELPNLLAATRAYCTVIKRKQEEEREVAFKN